jgi:methylenetetrahydrofolate--tRNA-(uracil-5-)-methyltransferase
MESIKVIGGGLAGCEAAWQAANLGIPADLYEMRPATTTPAHTTGHLAELVCSNSLKSDSPISAPGILKSELRLWGSLIMQAADKARIPAGQALAVDREIFATAVTEAVEDHPLITVHRQEIRELPSRGPAVVATGPLTSEAMSEALAEIAGSSFLYFYDAISPIVDGESIDYETAFFASRYGKGGKEDYLNCPLSGADYERFYEALVGGETYEPHAFEEVLFFEGCLPIEEMARRGRDTLRFGPMKPVGLSREGQAAPYAVVQLRREDAPGSAYNLVGFQTKLKWREQARIFRLIPGLGGAEFLRYGMVHRNTYINAPAVLGPGLAFRRRPDLFCAGQLTGVEGYLESTATGLVAGLNAARLIQGLAPATFPAETAFGAILGYLMRAEPRRFQPMNINFGLFPPLAKRLGSKEATRSAIAERALQVAEDFRSRCLTALSKQSTIR